MTLDLPQLLDLVTSHAQRLGGSDAVIAHEPESAPGGRGVTVTASLAGIGAARGGSSVKATTARVELAVRVWYPADGAAAARAELVVAAAADGLMRAYTGDYTLSGQVMNIDLLGRYGPGLEGRAGYADLDGETYRVFTITLPMIISDLWEQTP